MIKQPNNVPCEVCGEKKADYIVDPYLAEVHNQTVYAWLCEDCYQEKLNDI